MNSATPAPMHDAEHLRDMLRTLRADMARALAPRKPLTVSEWADMHRRLSSKGSAQPGPWRTDRNPVLREPMDSMSARHPARDVVLMFPIQIGKTEVAINTLGYIMDHNPGPVMVCLPGEVSMNKWIAQKLAPMLDETQAVRDALTSTMSRDGVNRREFKDFAGGQLFIEHAGSPQRLKSTTVRFLLVDEVDEFAASLHTGDDPLDMLHGRTSAFPATAKRLYISTPTLRGVSRIEALYERSDQRRYHVPCPHCGEMQPLQWTGLKWGPRDQSGRVTMVRYVCNACGAEISESSKPDMLQMGQWVAENPNSRIRGYTLNALYYPIGLGPRWADLVEMWLDAQGDTAKLKTFLNDRLAQSWEDQTTRALRENSLADRAEPYPVRTAPEGALILTAGVDTQDNRLAVQIVGWGPRPTGAGLAFWVIDYTELHGDPADGEVWAKLTELLNTPIRHASGALLRIEAVAQDIGGHRTEAVKNWVRERRVRRPMAVFGAVSNTAPLLGRPKALDVTWRGKTDLRGVLSYQVGTVAAKHWLYAVLSTDSEKEPEQRVGHFSADMPLNYFSGMLSEVFNPSKNRFEHRRGAPRNEALDTWVYAFAAAHHPELRLHRHTAADWQRRANAIAAAAGKAQSPDAPQPLKDAPIDSPTDAAVEAARPTPFPIRRTGGFSVRNW